MEISISTINHTSVKNYWIILIKSYFYKDFNRELMKCIENNGLYFHVHIYERKLLIIKHLIGLYLNVGSPVTSPKRRI